MMATDVFGTQPVNVTVAMDASTGCILGTFVTLLDPESVDAPSTLVERGLSLAGEGTSDSYLIDTFTVFVRQTGVAG